MSGTNQWAIHIVSTPGGVMFQPWVPNANPGDPAHAQIGDIITWGDDTGEAVDLSGAPALGHDVLVLGTGSGDGGRDQADDHEDDQPRAGPCRQRHPSN